MSAWEWIGFVLLGLGAAVFAFLNVIAIIESFCHIFDNWFSRYSKQPEKKTKPPDPQ